MDALLVTGGEVPPFSRLSSRLSDFGLICAADSGLDTLAKWGISPSLIVGDMDSLSDPKLLDQYPKASIIRAFRDKDETDTELGIKALVEAGASRIVLAGGGGGRLDHLLALRALFERGAEVESKSSNDSERAARRSPWLRPDEWHTKKEVVYLVREGHTIERQEKPGRTVSVFPLADGASGMSSTGLHWNLSGLDWKAGDFGVSNRTDSGSFRVGAGRGDILVLVELDD